MTVSTKDPFAEVTEKPGISVTCEALSMLYTRYHLAASFVEGKDVLEVACGPGMGLGYIARRAHQIIGGDYSQALLQMAIHHYGSRIPLIRLDAQTLPFKDATFDVVIFYEAIYYLARPESFIGEARRVLRPDGVLLLCTANKDQPGFVRSPHSHRYFSAHELRHLLEEGGFTVKLFGAFPATQDTFKDKVLYLAIRIARALNLVPGTLKGRAFLKRLVYGKLYELKPEVSDGMAELYPLVPITTDSLNSQYKVLYAVARAR